ncbi:MAG: uracil-DNA glycosylase [Gammaproteobacteria bacterium]
MKENILIEFKTRIHPSWNQILETALSQMDQTYLKELLASDDWLPGSQQIFNAFRLPLHKTRYILFGESPYPRAHSANGYAFWDAHVETIWSPTGLSATVNRATSLRNFIKMLLIAEGLLSPQNTSQEAIAIINKEKLVQTANDFFTNFLNHGILLLNASLVLSKKPVQFDAKQWRPFMNALLHSLVQQKKDIQLILFGNIAKAINQLPSANYFKQFHSEHPYNISFITNPNVIEFFKGFKLLRK